MSLFNSIPSSWSPLLRPWYRAAKSAQYGVTLPYYRLLDRYRLKDLDSIYTDEYFEKRSEPPYDEGTKVAADVFDEHFNPNSVFDIGCAIGVYLQYFSEKGASVAGIEGSQRAVEKALVDTIQNYDLRDSPRIEGQSFDLVLCIEVAEHLHSMYAESLVESILSATHDDSTVVFTAAPPGQCGTNHINLQHPQYWIELFDEHGWGFQERKSLELKGEIRQRSENPLIMTKNLMIFTKSD